MLVAGALRQSVCARGTRTGGALSNRAGRGKAAYSACMVTLIRTKPAGVPDSINSARVPECQQHLKSWFQQEFDATKGWLTKRLLFSMSELEVSYSVLSLPNKIVIEHVHIKHLRSK